MYSNELICNILNYLDDNINSDISIDFISSIFCYDKFYIMKKLKKEIGMSIISYLNAIKIFNSLKFYKNNYSILKISLNSGFNSLEYYSEIFKKVIGVSPIIYKKFINFDVGISKEENDKIVNSLVNLNSLKNKVISYKNNVRSKESKLVKKLYFF